VKRDDNHLKENYVLFSKRNRKARNNGSEDVEKFCRSIEFVIFMDQCIKTFVDSLSDHLSPGNKFSIKFVKNILQVVSFDTFLGVEQFEELLDKLRRYINFEALYISGFVDNQLKEKLIDTLKVGPGGVNLFFLFDTCF
jgi:hypothetical protein